MNPDALRVTADDMQRGVLLPCGAVYKQIRDAAEKIERLRESIRNMSILRISLDDLRRIAEEERRA
jgi:hypothetical protein